MRLIDLTVRRGDEIVRAVSFKAGLNLILDAPTQSPTQSGNNVGKTTVLRLIDFCLGSDGDDIWTDAEFKKVNQEIYDYLHGAAPVSVTLQASSGPNTHTISRTFVASGKKNVDQFVVDGRNVQNLKEYRSAVKAIAFGLGGEKPSLRQLSPKFVRSSPLLMARTLKYLGDFTSEAAYEAVHLFLFGFTDSEVLTLRPKLASERTQLQRDLQALTRHRKEGELEQLLIHLRREVGELESVSRESANVPDILRQADFIAKIRSDAADVSAQLAEAESEIASIKMAVDELVTEHSGIDYKSVETIYKEASKYLPALQHDWEEVSNFVDNLRKRKRRFLEEQQRKLLARSEFLRKKLENLEERELSGLRIVEHTPDFARAIEIRAELTEKLKRLGSIENSLEDIRALRSRLELTEKKLLETQERIAEGKAKLSERVATFNSHFSKLSKELYGEEYLLSFEDKKGVVTFQLSAVGANVGQGKKMSQTAAFDLAYIRFVQQEALPFPIFVCHDGLEAIHGNQLSSLLSEAGQKSGQFVVATLRDKLPKMSDGFIKANTILELSHTDKFFRL